MIKTIIFDVDGVVIDTGYFTQRLEDDFAISTSKTLPFFKGKFQNCQLGRADLKDELRKCIPAWGWDKSVDALVDYWFSDGKNNLNFPLLNEIKVYRQHGIKCFFGTNQEKYRLEYLKNDLELGNVLDGFFASCDIGFRKPAKEFFNYIAEKLPGIDKSEILFWDSDQDIVDTARKYGFRAELYTSFSNFKNTMTNYLS